MSYTPTIWQTGDTITEDKLNKIEQGILANCDYDNIDDKPSINGVELSGNKSTAELGIDHVAFADNLVANSGVTSSSPYLFRRSPQNVSAELHRLVGGTVAFNQVNQDTQKSGTHTPSGSSYYDAQYMTGSGVANNVYFISATFTYNGSGTDVMPWLQAGTTKRFNVYLTSTPRTMQTIIKTTSPVTRGIGITTGSGGRTLTSSDAWAWDNCMYMNLTRMFGPAIAEHINDLETANAGAGVAFVTNLFPSAYYPYSASALQSVQTSARVTRGFNQWDEEWEVGGYSTLGEKSTSVTDRIRSKNYIPILPNTQYRSTVGGYYFEYGADKTFLSRTEHYSNTTFTTGSGACYMTFHTYSSYGTVYKHDITIGFSVAEMNGVYVPYKAKSYPIDDVVLRGIPKLTNGQLDYDGDIYLPTGEVTRKYGIVDLGTLTWTKTTTSTIDVGYYFYAVVSDMYAGTERRICGKYPFLLPVGLSNVVAAYGTAIDKFMFAAAGATNGLRVYICDSAYTDAATFKTAMSGVYLVYALASATTESADPYTEVQLAGTTEQFVSESVVPVGNEAFYAEDLTNVVQNLAPLPTTAGTYKLQVTVSGGVPSYSWVSG